MIWQNKNILIMSQKNKICIDNICHIKRPSFFKKKSLADVLVIYKSWRKKKLTHPVLILAHWSAS